MRGHGAVALGLRGGNRALLQEELTGACLANRHAPYRDTGERMPLVIRR